MRCPCCKQETLAYTVPPVLTPAQAERIVAGLDDRDGGHDGIAAFIWNLAGQQPPVEDES